MKKIFKFFLNRKQYNRLRFGVRSLKDSKRIERRNFYSTFLKSGDLVFDVGANIGNRVDTFLNIGLQVVAVEPQEECVEYMSSKFKKYREKLTIVRKGCGESRGSMDMYLSEVDTISSFNKNWNTRFKNVEWKDTVTVDITTLDDLIEENGVPKFIKIDVEGFELSVLKGLTYPVMYLSFEFHEIDNLEKIISCINQVYSVNKNVLVNYCLGEDMKFVNTEWLNPQVFIENIRNKIRQDSRLWGDIYLKSKAS